jgi:hypothetical protein
MSGTRKKGGGRRGLMRRASRCGQDSCNSRLRSCDNTSVGLARACYRTYEGVSKPSEKASMAGVDFVISTPASLHKKWLANLCEFIPEDCHQFS